MTLLPRTKSVLDNGAKNLLKPKIINMCFLCMRRFHLKMGFGLFHCKCTSRTSNKSGFKFRYRSHGD